jgi:hypothetical protein
MEATHFEAIPAMQTTEYILYTLQVVGIILAANKGRLFRSTIDGYVVKRLDVSK